MREAVGTMPVSRELVRWGTERLTESSSPGLDAQLLLGHAWGQDRVWVLAHEDDPVPSAIAARYERLIEERAAGVPVAYLRGYVSWMDFTLQTDRTVLIPRPETELLAEGAAAMARMMGASELADIGTGSGALALALARLVPGARVTAVDASPSAVTLAIRNVNQFGLSNRVAVLCGDLIAPLTSRPDLIVANLPYLSDERMNDLPRDVRWEPALALAGGVDGLSVYARLLEQLRGRGWYPALWLEIDGEQSAGARALLDGFGPGQVQILPDYAGIPRMAVYAPPESAEQ